jgi:hypothetical protein
LVFVDHRNDRQQKIGIQRDLHLSRLVLL